MVDGKKPYGYMDDGKKSYADAIEDLRQKVIKNFFTDQESGPEKTYSKWNDVNQDKPEKRKSEPLSE